MFLFLVSFFTLPQLCYIYIYNYIYIYHYISMITRFVFHFAIIHIIYDVFDVFVYDCFYYLENRL